MFTLEENKYQGKKGIHNIQILLFLFLCSAFNYLLNFFCVYFLLLLLRPKPTKENHFYK